jgi:putative tryptophan/tyrosine transport system substrate-binding protein
VNRRAVIVGVLLVPMTALSQQTFRLALVSPTTPATDMNEAGSPIFGALLLTLRELGYSEGQNLVVGRYSGQGRTLSSVFAHEIIAFKPDLIFVVSVRLARVLKAATNDVPMVVYGGDPVALGLITNLAHPGGNLTGVVVDAGIEIESKRLELLREAVPSASRVAYLAPRSMWESSFGTGAQVAGRRIGVSVVGVPIESPAGETEYRRAFASMSTDAPDALFVADTEENLTYRRLIVELAREARLPTFYPFREFVAAGGLMTYAVDLEDLARHRPEQSTRSSRGQSRAIFHSGSRAPFRSRSISRPPQHLASRSRPRSWPVRTR